ncbi:MAG: alpha/beta fold hydrolase [Candidatus Omnitrophica bacterium]|nr:alpha/beta fold hydrolase [Candidatus Omnitrophota bacterium]
MKRNTFIFEEDSPVTFLPLIENYNFTKGRSQGFNALIPSPWFSMPPKKRFVVLTSIKDEYLKIGRRKIKTENLILKIRDYPQASIWVAKSDKALIKLENPSQGLSITRTFEPIILKAKEYQPQPEGFSQKDVIVKSKAVELGGTLSGPAGNGPFPAVLLISGQGPNDRRYQGLFSSLAAFLAKNGYYVLSLDKRGIGSSTGNLASTALSDEIDDAYAAFNYLASQPVIDPKKIFLIGHGKGAYYAMRVAVKNTAPRGLVLLAPSVNMSAGTRSKIEAISSLASKAGWSEEYLKLSIRTIEETAAKATTLEGDWAYILGKKCFLKDIREELAENPMDTIKQIKTPVLILQGGRDEEASVKTASLIDAALEDSGNKNHSLTYYAYLGTFLGEPVSDGIHQTYYTLDREVLENIKNWLNNNLDEAAVANTLNQTAAAAERQ